jgi:hypothetical protein
MGHRLLDLYCCAGGASVGYHRAGFEVTGVDVMSQRNYPFEFVWGDALTIMKVRRDWIRETFSAIHASPPCQDYSTLTQGNREREDWWDRHEDLIDATREGLQDLGLPWVIENVPASWIRPDITLCGEMFGLGVIRHRYFEIGGWAPGEKIAHKPHRGKTRGWRHGKFTEGPYVPVYGAGGGKGSVADWREAMGIDWMSTRRELSEAIPPAYTEWVGGQLLTWLGQPEPPATSPVVRPGVPM